MTLTNEQIEALAVLLTAHTGASPTYGSIWIAPDMETCCRAAAALRQWIEERDMARKEDAIQTRCCNELTEERDREDRLLRAGWKLMARKSNSQGWQYRWRPFDTGYEWTEHPDRATAARLAEEKMNG